jgi:hypothetical protein
MTPHRLTQPFISWRKNGADIFWEPKVSAQQSSNTLLPAWLSKPFSVLPNFPQIAKLESADCQPGLGTSPS